jgi:hypothetical protein
MRWQSHQLLAATWHSDYHATLHITESQHKGDLWDCVGVTADCLQYRMLKKIFYWKVGLTCLAFSSIIPYFLSLTGLADFTFNFQYMWSHNYVLVLQISVEKLSLQWLVSKWHDSVAHILDLLLMYKIFIMYRF